MKKKKIKEVDIFETNEQVIHILMLIKNNAFCSYTLPRARRLLVKIKDKLSEQEYKTIYDYINHIDIDNPDVWQPEWARKDAYKSQLMFMRGEFSKYINQLITEKKVGESAIC